MQQRSQIRRLTRRSLLLVLIIVQDLVPFIGNLPLGPLSITTMPVTVAVIAALFGPIEGTLAGMVWGILTFIRAFVYPSSALAPLIFTNPLISVVPRILVGLFAGWTFWLVQKSGRTGIAASLSGLVASLTNTILVLGGIYLFANTPQVAAGYHVSQTNLGVALAAIVGTNGIAEAVLAAIVVPLLVVPLCKVIQRLEK
ncbi:MAG TPA: ECF transporter S component [Candidatus Limosilactobacillus faecipullorum]|nr:ECF transporter S component [Candidatus Limosilactobacillus faecipullorum]